MSQSIEMAVRIDITVLQSIEMAVRIDITVLQSIEIAVRRDITVSTDQGRDGCSQSIEI